LSAELAVAFHSGHRRSVDFDLFTNKEFDNLKIRKKILKFGKIERVLTDEAEQYTVVVKGVKLTFLCYPFKIAFPKKIDSIIKTPDLPTLAAMKALVLGRRAKWKDYVDLYFIMKNYYSIEQIVKKAKSIFHSEFNEKIFRAHLAYFKDIDYSEKVVYLEGFSVKDAIVKKSLIEFSLQ